MRVAWRWRVLGVAAVCATLVSGLAPGATGTAAARLQTAAPAHGHQSAGPKRAPVSAQSRKPTPRPASKTAPTRTAPAPKSKVPAPPPASGEAKPPASTTSGPQRLRTDAEYQLLQAELRLAKSNEPYLVLVWDPQPQVLIKLQGAIVAGYPLRIEGDTGDVKRFRDKFRGPHRRILRGLAEKYLYTAKGQTPDSVLTIVGNVLNLDPKVMQREVPGWFELKWRDDLVLEVRADVEGRPLPGVDLRIVKLQQTLRRPFGETRLRVRLDRQQALTLYRLSHAGIATLSPLF